MWCFTVGMLVTVLVVHIKETLLHLIGHLDQFRLGTFATPSAFEQRIVTSNVRCTLALQVLATVVDGEA